MKYPRRGLAAFAIALAAVLTACAPTPELVPIAQPSPTATPTPTPTPTPTGSPLPTLAYGGDCTAIADTGELSTAMGVSLLTPREFADVGVRTLGGTECSWHAESGAGVSASALPLEVVPSDVQQRYVEPVCEQVGVDYGGCRVALGDDETWVLVTVDELYWGPDGEIPEDAVEATARGQLAAVAPLIRSSLPSAGIPAPAERTSEWWAPSSCGDIESLVPVASVLGGEVRDGYPSEFSTGVIDEIAERQGTRIDCKWHAIVGEEMPAILLTAFPGGGWDFADAASKASEHRDLAPVTVEGATSAVAGIGGLRPNASALMATDGVNILWQIEAPDAPAAAAAVIAALAAAD